MRKSSPSARDYDAIERQLDLLDGFRVKTQALNRLLEQYDLYGMTTEDERERFWGDFFAQGEEVIIAFRELVALRGGSARERLLRHLKAHVGEVVQGTTLASVAGISEWARRVRELDVEQGYRISTNEDDPGLRPGQYRLETLEPDLDRAAWWKLKKRLREDKSANPSDKVLELLARFAGRPVGQSELEYVAGSSWQTALGELQRRGYRIRSCCGDSGLERDWFRLDDEQRS